MGVEIGPVSTEIWTEISILSKVIVFRLQNRAKPFLWGPNLQIGIQCGNYFITYKVNGKSGQSEYGSNPIFYSNAAQLHQISYKILKDWSFCPIGCIDCNDITMLLLKGFYRINLSGNALISLLRSLVVQLITQVRLH